MAYRVKLHQQRRPSSWQTFEAPFDADTAINEAFCHHDIILFDCLTLYLSNYLCSEQTQTYTMEQLSAGAKDMMSALIEAVQAQNTDKTCVFVTNEVGSGIVPENALARKYRDLAGLCNQQIAKFPLKSISLFLVIPVKNKIIFIILYFMFFHLLYKLFSSVRFF